MSQTNHKLYMKQSCRPTQPEIGYAGTILKKWKGIRLFNSINNKLIEQNKTDTPFFLLDGPPYANGGAHMGHVLNKTVKDLLLKSHWYLGKSVKFTPGWDCHGLPLELLIDKKYQLKDIEEKRKLCKNLALKSLIKQRTDFENLGIFADFQNPYLTLSEEMKAVSYETLGKMFSLNLLDYKLWPVNYCPVCASSLAEAELEYKEFERNELYFKYEIFPSNEKIEAKYNSYKVNNCNEFKHYALVWTTTPWTLPMNQALAFNSNLFYKIFKKNSEFLYVEQNSNITILELLNNLNYIDTDIVVKGAEFLGIFGTSPILNQKTSLLDAPFVESGMTGFVHIACAHGVEDFELGVKNKLTPLNFLDKNGKYENSTLLPTNFIGLKNTQVDNIVFDILKKYNLFFHSYSSKVELACCWRHKAKVYYQSTWQVFLALEKLKENVELMLDNSCLGGEYKIRLKSMLLNRQNWCLSRQRYWGTPLNLLVDKRSFKLSPLTSIFLKFSEKAQIDNMDELLKNNPSLFVVNDVLDVWFDSGNVLNCFNYYNSDLNQADFVVEGKDQFRGWFQALLWMSAVNYMSSTKNSSEIQHRDFMPYKNLYVHGFVLDDKKLKFAKSSGNGLSASESINLFGVDTVRLWASLQDENMDVIFSKQKMEEVKTYYQRFRLSLRFLSANSYRKSLKDHRTTLGNFYKDNDFDFYLYAFEKLNILENSVKQYLTKNLYKDCIIALYEFCNVFLSSCVFEVLKQPLYLKSDTTKEKQMAECFCYELFLKLSKIMKIFCPFLAEEFFAETSIANEFESVFYLDTISLNDNYPLSRLKWGLAFNLKIAINKQLDFMQKNKSVKSSSQLLVRFNFDKSEFLSFQNLCDSMSYKYFLNVSVVEFNLREELTKSSDSGLGLIEIISLKDNSDYVKCPRCWNYFQQSFLKDGLCLECAC